MPILPSVEQTMESWGNSNENPKVSIEFERSDLVYSPGENITGSITIQLSKATKCKGREFPPRIMYMSFPFTRVTIQTNIVATQVLVNEKGLHDMDQNKKLAISLEYYRLVFGGINFSIFLQKYPICQLFLFYSVSK